MSGDRFDLGIKYKIMAIELLQDNRFRITINGVLGGHQIFENLGNPGEFLSSVAIDPDLPVDLGTLRKKPGGVITPVSYSKFSGANVNSPVVVFITNPKNTLIYVILKNGKIISYTNVLTSETLVDTVAGGNAEGGFYYNNYIYITGTGASKDDMSRYGPLDNSPALADNVWRGATLGAQTGLGNAVAYPSFGSVTYPKHIGHVHSNNKAYVLDFLDGVGYLHSIKTTKSSAEGDTDDGSAYNELDLPFNFLPTCIARYGKGKIVVGGIQTTDTGIKQGNGLLIFWDTFSDSWELEVPVPSALVTALYNKNGELFVGTGNRNNGMSLLKYLGGKKFELKYFFPEGHSPFHHAMDAYENRIAWGGAMTDPSINASVFAMGFKGFISNAIHNIMRITGTSTNPVISAMMFAQQASGILPRMIVAWKDGSGHGIDGNPSAGRLSIWRSEMFNLGRKFQIEKIRFPLSVAVGSNHTITPKIHIDDFQATDTLNAINNTNFPNAEKNAVYNIGEEKVRSGWHNFNLELAFTGAGVMSILMPITIEGRFLADD